MWTRAFQVLKTRIQLAADQDPALVRTLEALTDTYGPAREGQQLAYTIRAGRWPQLQRDGRVLCVVDDPVDLPAVFEHDLYLQVIHRCRDGLALHAAAVAVDGEVVLLLGGSGAGKSTVSLELVQRGARYLTDEHAVVYADGTVQGVTRPITLDTARRPANLPQAFVTTLSAYRGEGGDCGSLLVQPPPAQLCHHARPLKTVVFLLPPQTASVARRLSTGEALCRLWACVLRPHRGALGWAIRLLSRHPVHAVGGDVDQVCHSIGRLSEAVCGHPASRVR